MTYILALDQGTSSRRALLSDAAGAVVARAQQSLDSSNPHDGWVEQAPGMIWSARLPVGRQARDSATMQAPDIAAIGIPTPRDASGLGEHQTADCP